MGSRTKEQVGIMVVAHYNGREYVLLQQRKDIGKVDYWTLLMGKVKGIRQPREVAKSIVAATIGIKLSDFQYEVMHKSYLGNCILWGVIANLGSCNLPQELENSRWIEMEEIIKMLNCQTIVTQIGGSLPPFITKEVIGGYSEIIINKYLNLKYPR